MRAFDRISKTSLVALAVLGIMAAAAGQRPLWEACRAALDMNAHMNVEGVTAEIESGRLQGAVLAAAYKNRGCIDESQADDTLAIADYSKALTLDPSDAEAYFLRGRTFGNGFHYARAIADYDAALRLVPDDAETYYRRGRAYENGRHDHAAAISDFTASLRFDPDNPAAYHMRAISYLNLGRKAEADADSAAEKRLIASMPPSRRFAKRQAGEWE